MVPVKVQAALWPRSKDVCSGLMASPPSGPLVRHLWVLTPGKSSFIFENLSWAQSSLIEQTALAFPHQSWTVSYLPPSPLIHRGCNASCLHISHKKIHFDKTDLYQMAPEAAEFLQKHTAEGRNRCNAQYFALRLAFLHSGLRLPLSPQTAEGRQHPAAPTCSLLHPEHQTGSGTRQAVRQASSMRAC